MRRENLRASCGSPACLLGGLAPAGPGQDPLEQYDHLLYKFEGWAKHQSFGCSVYLPGDVTGDGYGDFIAGASCYAIGPPWKRGAATVLSGHPWPAYSKLFYMYEGTGTAEELGLRVCRTGDVTGDGAPDILVGTYEGINGNLHAGSVLVYAARSLHGPGEVPVDGVRVLELYAPAGAGRAFALGFSLGTEPGIPVGTRTLPLAWDALLQATFGHPALAGTLDGKGGARLSLGIPQDPALSGITFYAGGVILDPGAPLGVLTLTNPEAVKVQ